MKKSKVVARTRKSRSLNRVARRKPSTTEMLKKVMECFYPHDGHLLWSYREGVTLGEMTSGEIEKELTRRFFA